MFADPNPYDCDGPVIFADAYLKAAVEAALGVTDPNATDMLALTFLTVDERGIADLTGLEYATNLTYLNLVINEIIDNHRLIIGGPLHIGLGGLMIRKRR